MRATPLKILLLAASVLIGGSVIVRQGRATSALRDDLERRREQNREIAALRADRARLTTQQISADELKKLREAHATAGQLQREIAELTRPLERHDAPPSEVPPPSPHPELIAKQWSNAGTATPAATLETILWSAIGGDTDALAAMIAFDPAGRAKVDALFARLPEAMRGPDASPEKMFATLMAARLPQDLATAQVVSEIPQNENAVVLQMHLQHTNGSEKDAGFYFSRGPRGWQLVVPPGVVENYQAMLASPPAKIPAATDR